jgi:SAM-dependent methyltransferase
MSNRCPEYLMDDPREAQRLAEKVNPAHWVAKYFAPPLVIGRDVLDVGCGPGVIAAQIARDFPDNKITGIDLSEDRVAEARKNMADLPNATVQQGVAIDLPFLSGSFDLVYSRFLLEYLIEREKAIAEMVRVCRPGGRVLLQDLDGQLVWHYPIEEDLQSGIDKTLKFLGKTGFDPFVGRKLFAFARSAGLTDLNVRAESYHLFAGAIDEYNFRLWELKLDIALPAIAKALDGEAAAINFKGRFLHHLKHEDTLTYSVVFTVVGTKPQLASKE